MQCETDHNKHQAWKGYRYLLSLFLLTFLLTGCQQLPHKPDVPLDQASANEFGLLRDTAVSPETPPDPVAEPPEIPVENTLPTDKEADETLDELPPDTPVDTGLAETNIVDELIPEKEFSIVAPQQIQPEDRQALYQIDEALPEDVDTEMPEPVIDKTPPPQKTTQMVLDEALGFCEAAQEFWQKGELENALESLDQAYSLILDIEIEDQPQQMQQKEDLRFLISKRILEIYASRNTVANGSHNAIPLEMNRHVQAEIRLFTKGGEKNFFKQSLVRSGKYRPFILSKLKEAGMPEELSWLPLIESGFKVKALSKARALGLWQFIPSTGYKFGLKRNKYIDERIDPAKATNAAIAYLQEVHGIFGDWITALAAYNC